MTNRSPQFLPQLRQAYCTKHFVDVESRLYFMSENYRYGEAASKLKETAPRSNKSGKRPSAPTRVQPPRRAREKAVAEQIETKAEKRRNASKTDKEVDLERLEAILTQCRETLGFHLPWEDFSAKLTSRIKRTTERLRDAQRENQYYTLGHSNCPFTGTLPLECRYCGWEPEVAENDGSPRTLMPPAPMHSIDLTEIQGRKTGDFGGFTFAVDVCGDTEMVVPLKLTGWVELLEELRARQQSTPDTGFDEAAVAALAELLAPTGTNNTEAKSKKRGRSTSSTKADAGEKTTATSRKKRRKTG